MVREGKEIHLSILVNIFLSIPWGWCKYVQDGVGHSCRDRGTSQSTCWSDRTYPPLGPWRGHPYRTHLLPPSDAGPPAQSHGVYHAWQTVRGWFLMHKSSATQRSTFIRYAYVRTCTVVNLHFVLLVLPIGVCVHSKKRIHSIIHNLWLCQRTHRHLVLLPRLLLIEDLANRAMPFQFVVNRPGWYTWEITSSLDSSHAARNRG